METVEDVMVVELEPSEAVWKWEELVSPIFFRSALVSGGEDSLDPDGWASVDGMAGVGCDGGAPGVTWDEVDGG